ncbi:MAG: hypothetical protein ABL907_01530 [Hyphomicrobium sp.]
MAKPSNRMQRLLVKWPLQDRHALEDAFAGGHSDLDSDDDELPYRAMAAEWAESTRLKNVEFYTRWIEFLEKNDFLDPFASPSSRITRQRLRAYVASLARVSSVTRAMYLEGLRDTLRIIDPNGDYRFLSRQVLRLHRKATPSRNQRHMLISPSEMFHAGIDYMQSALADSETDKEAANMYQDGLMIAMIACKALRRANFATMQIGANIDRNADNEFEVRFASIETKQRRRIQAQLSQRLTPFIDRWLNRVRLVLTEGRNSDAMWIGGAGADLTPSAFYHRFCKITVKMFGVTFNPHFVRKIVATGMAISHPDLVRMTSSLLDHSSDQSAAYNLADQLSASKNYIALLNKRRNQALKQIPRAAPRQKLS